MYRKKLMTSAAGAVCALALSAGSANAQSADGNVLHPLYGDISPFYGDISPFYGDISPFWGDISPFWGDISPFYGDISPFWGDISPFDGDISPFYGDIAPFWGDISPFMRELQTLPSGSDPDRALDELYQRSRDFWRDAVEAQTGATFDEFAEDVFSRYGLSLYDGGDAFAALSDVDRARFLFDWYDGLMAFSGRDHVDHWMRTANWSPTLAQSSGGGRGVVIGLLDAVSSDADVLASQVDAPWWVWTGEGSTATVGGHGAAVASLLVADHDGRGIMGLAPHASVALDNPYDESGTTNWNEVADGVRIVHGSGASVINLSLGIPGYAFHPDWSAFYQRWVVAGVVRNDLGAMADALQQPRTTYQPVFVHAAGNDGAAQSANINWDFTLNPSFIVVGSVGPTGQISQFSNTPGTACLMNNGVCQEPLMNRFIVAPGEWILTSDGEGGVTRQSGTSFAAPMVTGAVALLHGHWPWLRNHARESADIILMTARDLGAPGVDPVYGRGMLDIAASQAPINMANLYQRQADGTRVNLTTSGTGGELLGIQDGYVTVFEDVGATYRDFRMPLTSGLSTVNSAPVLESSALARSLDTATSSTTTTSTSTRKKRRFADDFSAQVANPWGFDMRMSLSALEAGTFVRDGELPYAIDMMLAGDNVTLFAGRGQGALALDSRSGFGASSYTLDGGGANPILGLASGGGYVAAEVPLGGGLSLAAGFTRREAQVYEADFVTGEERPMFEEFAPYRSAAAHALLRQTITDGFSVSASYTYLREENGMLGMQSANPDDFAAGTETDAATFGLEWAANDRFGLSLSATYGRMREGGSQSLAISEEGADVSAFEVAFDFNGVFGRNDFAQLRLAQPMRVESGSLDVTSIDVVDRETGELGAVTQRVQLGGGGRQYFVEGAYATPLFEGQGEVGMFVRLDASEAGVEPMEEVVGARFNLNF